MRSEGKCIDEENEVEVPHLCIHDPGLKTLFRFVDFACFVLLFVLGIPKCHLAGHNS